MNIMISIVAVAFNEARHVARLQQSIARLVRPSDIAVESLLVDGGSTDGTAAFAVAAGFTRVLELPGASIPVCRNRGVAAATGTWIAFVDADCELAPDWLACAFPLMCRERPLLLGWPAAPPEPMNWLQRAWFIHWTCKNPAREDWHGVPVVRAEGFRLATTRNMLLHREVFDHLGGFNEQLHTGEDTDFAFRAYMAGIPVLGVPGLRVWHHAEPATLRQFFRQQLWHANRRSYEHIRRLSGGRIGGNAPRFTWLFLLCFAVALAGVVGAVSFSLAVLVLLLPLLMLIFGPALLIGWRARKPTIVLPLGVIYFVYGLARSIDLLGWHRQKPSWKKTKDS